MNIKFGRYGAIIVTIIIFIALVVSVLATNYYLTFQTEANADVVNIAGRQRMLSQRIAKSLLNIGERHQNQKDYQPQLLELNTSFKLFDTTLTAFKHGGETENPKTGITLLSPIRQGNGVDTVDKAITIWEPLSAKINLIIRPINDEDAAKKNSVYSSFSNNLSQAISYSDENINSLLSLMNDLTNHTESIANDAASKSRKIQTLGILSSLFCFAVIMYLILGQLRVADKKARAARHETNRIFETVNQGLFLIGKNGEIGKQKSKALESIFDEKLDSSQKFIAFIKPLVSDDDLQKIERYVKLFFNPHKKQKLLKDLNPLNQLSIQTQKNGLTKHKFVSFSFTRVIQDGSIVSVLVSVADITKEIELERELEAESARNEQQFKMIKVILSTDAELLPAFIDSSSKSYSQINQILRDPASTSEALKDKTTSIFSLIHKIKGESAALGLNFISNSCHQFENELEKIRTDDFIKGDDFLSLTIQLERLITTNSQITSALEILSQRSKKTTFKTDSLADSEHKTQTSLTALANDIAKRQGKKVKFSIAGFENNSLPIKAKLTLFSMASQLLRNAISHGIETPDKRLVQGKSESGEIVLALYEEGKNNYRLICEDDGNGLNFDVLKDRAVKLGLISEAAVESLQPAKLLALIANNKISSKNSVDEDSGRGVGLGVVVHLANKLNGVLSLRTNKKRGTRFTVQLSGLSMNSLESQSKEKQCA